MIYTAQLQGRGLVPGWVSDYQLCEQFSVSPKVLNTEFTWLDIQRISVMNSARSQADQIKADRGKAKNRKR